MTNWSRPRGTIRSNMASIRPRFSTLSGGSTILPVARPGGVGAARPFPAIRDNALIDDAYHEDLHVTEHVAYPAFGVSDSPQRIGNGGVCMDLENRVLG